MARIRTIKPEFPTSESIGRLSRDARLLYILIWTLCDDEGRCKGSSRILASLLYPFDDDAFGLMDAWVEELQREECIIRFIESGNSYVQVCKWMIHQKIDRPSPSRIPSPPEGSRGFASEPRAYDADLGPRTMDLGSGPRIGTIAREREKNVPVNPEVSMLIDRIVVMHPKSQDRDIQVSEVKPSERISVVTAMNAEVERMGCSKVEALEMILDLTRQQAEAMSPGDRKFCKSVDPYFREFEYRIDYAARQETSNVRPSKAAQRQRENLSNTIAAVERLSDPDGPGKGFFSQPDSAARNGRSLPSGVGGDSGEVRDGEIRQGSVERPATVSFLPRPG